MSLSFFSRWTSLPSVGGATADNSNSAPTTPEQLSHCLAAVKGGIKCERSSSIPPSPSAATAALVPGQPPPRKPLSDATSRSLNANVPSDHAASYFALLDKLNSGMSDTPPKLIRASEYFKNRNSQIWDHNRNIKNNNNEKVQNANIVPSSVAPVSSRDRRQIHHQSTSTNEGGADSNGVMPSSLIPSAKCNSNSRKNTTASDVTTNLSAATVPTSILRNTTTATKKKVDTLQQQEERWKRINKRLSELSIQNVHARSGATTRSDSQARDDRRSSTNSGNNRTPSTSTKQLGHCSNKEGGSNSNSSNMPQLGHVQTNVAVPVNDGPLTLRELQLRRSQLTRDAGIASTADSSAGGQQFHRDQNPRQPLRDATNVDVGINAPLGTEPTPSISHDLVNHGNLGRKGSDSITSIRPSEYCKNYDDGARGSINGIINNSNSIDIERSNKSTTRKNNPHTKMILNAPMSNSATVNSLMPSHRNLRTFQNPMDASEVRSHMARPETTTESQARDDRVCLSSTLQQPRRDSTVNVNSNVPSDPRHCISSSSLQRQHHQQSNSSSNNEPNNVAATRNINIPHPRNRLIFSPGCFAAGRVTADAPTSTTPSPCNSQLMLPADLTIDSPDTATTTTTATNGTFDTVWKTGGSTNSNSNVVRNSIGNSTTTPTTQQLLCRSVVGPTISLAHTATNGSSTQAAQAAVADINTKQHQRNNNISSSDNGNASTNVAVLHQYPSNTGSAAGHYQQQHQPASSSIDGAINNNSSSSTSAPTLSRPESEAHENRGTLKKGHASLSPLIAAASNDVNLLHSIPSPASMLDQNVGNFHLGVSSPTEKRTARGSGHQHRKQKRGEKKLLGSPIFPSSSALMQPPRDGMAPLSVCDDAVSARGMAEWEGNGRVAANVNANANVPSFHTATNIERTTKPMNNPPGSNLSANFNMPSYRPPPHPNLCTFNNPKDALKARKQVLTESKARAEGEVRENHGSLKCMENNTIDKEGDINDSTIAPSVPSVLAPTSSIPPINPTFIASVRNQRIIAPSKQCGKIEIVNGIFLSASKGGVARRERLYRGSKMPLSFLIVRENIHLLDVPLPPKLTVQRKRRQQLVQERRHRFASLARQSTAAAAQEERGEVARDASAIINRTTEVEESAAVEENSQIIANFEANRKADELEVDKAERGEDAQKVGNESNPTAREEMEDEKEETDTIPSSITSMSMIMKPIVPTLLTPPRLHPPIVGTTDDLYFSPDEDEILYASRLPAEESVGGMPEETEIKPSSLVYSNDSNCSVPTDGLALLTDVNGEGGGNGAATIFNTNMPSSCTTITSIDFRIACSTVDAFAANIGGANNAISTFAPSLPLVMVPPTTSTPLTPPPLCPPNLGTIENDLCYSPDEENTLLGEPFVVDSFDRAEVDETMEAAPVVKDDVKEGGELVDDAQHLEVDNHINEHGNVQVALANSQSASSVGEAEAPVEASVHGKVVDGVEQEKNDNKYNVSDEDNSAVGGATGGEEDEMEDIDSAIKVTDAADAPNIQVLKAPPFETFFDGQEDDSKVEKEELLNAEERQEEVEEDNVSGANSMDDGNDGEEKSLDDVDTSVARTEAVIAPIVGEAEAPPASVDGHDVKDNTNYNSSHGHNVAVGCTSSENGVIALRCDKKGRKYCIGIGAGKSGPNTCSNYTQQINGLCKACDKISLISGVGTTPFSIQKPLQLVLRNEVEYSSYRVPLCMVKSCEKVARPKCKVVGIRGGFCTSHHKVWQGEHASAD